MRLNLFKSIVYLLVLSASGYTIAHADEEVEIPNCKSSLTCVESYWGNAQPDSSYCSGPNLNVNGCGSFRTTDGLTFIFNSLSAVPCANRGIGSVAQSGIWQRPIAPKIGTVGAPEAQSN